MTAQPLGDARHLPGVPGLRRPGTGLPSVLLTGLLTGLVAVAALLPTAAAASATTYRYWSYWHLTGGSWTFASTGPGGYRPADGSVEGWRFAVSSQGGGAAPRVRPSFAQVCGSTPVKDGTKRVAVVVDDGTQADAHPGDTVPGDSPRGVCAQVPETASGARVLSAVAAVRTDDGGLVCALDGYPSAGCGEVVAAPSPAPSSASSPRPTTRTTAGTGTRTPTARAAAPAPSTAGPPAATTGTPGTAPSTSSTSSTSSTVAATPPSTPSSRPSAAASPSTSGSALAAGTAAPTPSPTLVLGRTQRVSRSHGLPVGFIVGLVLVGALGAGAAVRARRGKGEGA
ncbi:MAG: SCO2322 family protein [Motilibacteraceae bacterium]